MLNLRSQCLGLLLLAWHLPALAATVYKTVDERGVVGFSDTPPAVAVAVETLHIKPPAVVPAQSQEQRQLMRETTDRMAADRRERERQRQRQQVVVLAPADTGATVAQRDRYMAGPERLPYLYVPVVPRPPWRPPPQAEPPWQRPHIVRGPNSQLMRPIVSSRRNAGVYGPDGYPARRHD